LRVAVTAAAHSEQEAGNDPSACAGFPRPTHRRRTDDGRTTRRLGHVWVADSPKTHARSVVLQHNRSSGYPPTSAAIHRHNYSRSGSPLPVRIPPRIPTPAWLRIGWVGRSCSVERPAGRLSWSRFGGELDAVSSSLVSRPEYVDLGAYYLVVEGSRVWAFRLQGQARGFLEMKPEQRLDTPHVNLFFESAARDLVSDARFLDPAKRQRLEQTHGAWPWVDHVVEIITGRRPFVEERRPPIDYRRREEPPPYVLPEPLDPGGPTKLKDTFIYEVRLVDELGEPIEDVLLRVSADSPPMRTDADGRIRYDDGSSSNALARFPDPKGLREALRPRWEQIREGDWLTEDAEHTYIDAADPLPMVKVRSDRLHTIVVQPRVICARILELLFDTNKSFLLPSALVHIREVRKLYDKRPRAKVLIVGHTDTTGEPNVNDPLSLNRAKAVKAYLRDDVQTWLDFYGDHMHPKARWGLNEDHLMLHAVLAESGEKPTDTPVRHFQATRGLEPDNKLGPNTREAIITEYMSLDGTTLPEAIDPIAHGCGENFPLEIPEGGNPDHTRDRRVELFFFDADLGVLPPPRGEISAAGSLEYLEWARRAQETHEFRPPPNKTRILLLDDEGTPMAGTAFCALIGRQPFVSGFSDGTGIAEFQLPVFCPETLGLAWGAHAPTGPFRFARRIFVDCTGPDASTRLQNLGFPAFGSLVDALHHFQSTEAVDAEPIPIGAVNETIPAATATRLNQIFLQKVEVIRAAKNIDAKHHDG
jgi:outer membrane protein OmpA-like peptidoglycan-associated protein